MAIFIQNIPHHVTENTLKVEIARALHKPDYSIYSSGSPLNLHVHILKRARKGALKCGILTVATEEIAAHFLRDYGPPSPQAYISIGARLSFTMSNKPARPYIVQELLHTPYVDPREEEERLQAATQLQSQKVHLGCIQFGWECRDDVFSVEFEMPCSGRGNMFYDSEKREFRANVDVIEDGLIRIMAIHAATIVWAGIWMEGPSPVFFLSLRNPATFEIADILRALTTGKPLLRQRHPYMHPSHAETAAFTSMAIRFVCNTEADVKTFRSLCKEARVPLETWVPPIEYRNLFHDHVQQDFAAWLSRLSWKIAFQLELIFRNLLADPIELLSLRALIERMLSDKGELYTEAFLRYFAIQAKTWFWYEDDNQNASGSLQELFAACTNDFVLPSSPRPRNGIDRENLFDCLHVAVSPTRIILDGPFVERSNRVMRSYPHNHDSFLRVSFVDENNLQYRLDREVDGRDFITRRFGGVLTDGLTLGGRHFKFLAYSQSALKESAVWFVKEFETPEGAIVNAASIIASLGDFSRPDPQLMRCPARYAARISQAFTATDAATSVEAEEIFPGDDIYNDTKTSCFTDGVGTISAELAQAIWRELRSKRRKGRRNTTYPRAYQIRFQGSKGMVSVDYNLNGRVITLRPSMIKFENPSSNVIEIARAFDKPGPFYLNRPLIMILEDLGVPYETFKSLQDTAVSQANDSLHSLERAARLLEAYGLGTSFRLTSVMLSLEKLGVRPPMDDEFFQRMMDFSLNHVLRELKHHARIPVKDAWNLVGVADIHGYLREGEVFIHIVPSNGEEPFYFEGRTLVTRSPTIHPGDVQIARAIGRPPPGSPFEKESLRNCVVFSIKGMYVSSHEDLIYDIVAGERSLPSCLGGGDLDGDVYCCTMLKKLMPQRTYEAASYEPAKRLELDRPSTMLDVANFVTEYIYSDHLGLIASQWLSTADQSTKGIFDKDCLLLSQLHSDAVDYPKTGRPVPLDKIPRPKFRIRPDWTAPETQSTSPNAKKFYESQRAIGHLFRAIDLPALETAQKTQRVQRRRLKEGHLVKLQDILDTFHAAEPFEEDEVSMAVYERITDFIAVGRHDDEMIVELWELYSQWVSQMQAICADHTTSNTRGAMLTEQEAVVGTIVAKCSQPRRRKDLMSKMRERTATLVQGVGSQIEGDEGILDEKSLERAWVAYRIANLEQDAFGARSFAWIALGEIFDAIKRIEESEGYL